MRRGEPLRAPIEREKRGREDRLAPGKEKKHEKPFCRSKASSPSGKGGEGKRKGGPRPLLPEKKKTRGHRLVRDDDFFSEEGKKESPHEE